MANKMLIDASHPEETRVVVLRGNRVEEFDFESASKKQLRGNIYLAKVTRVEPSLQAAFVDYGGNRHGFLAFSEIHPDYYQIPVSDRQALIEEDARTQGEDEEEESRAPRRSRRFRRGDRNGRRSEKRRAGDETVSEVLNLEAAGDAQSDPGEQGERRTESEAGAEALERTESDERPHAAGEPDDAAEGPLEAATAFLPVPGEREAPFPAPREEDPFPAEDPAPSDPDRTRRETLSEDERGAAADRDSPDERISGRRSEPSDEGEEEEDEHIEQLGGDALEEVPSRPQRYRKQYKIQEVIKRRQVLLVQVVKEERGNKGAALTTYLSLAGRYSVLMPNTARGGGISRKITDSEDRQRLKSIAQELEVPEGMGVILRTAGASRTKAEVKRDFEYLMRMWEIVRETTLQSTAPTLVYEEGSLIKRSIRDLFNKDIDEIVVAGETGYREAKEFMRLLMPSHVKNVRPYLEPQPIFAKYGAEAQLDAMFSNQVTLKSGGYIVINQTEALVAIDVNSGRSTREHNIEDTALRTNLEAADEITRQLRLRDLAGLIVIDFIDMEESRNNRSVERRMKEALKNDRARIQVGRISHFGLLEMSRQRIRTGVLEGSTVICPHCAGAGTLRSTSSVALHILRILEDALIKSASHDIIVRTTETVALYILNQKRAHLSDLERRFGVAATIAVDDTLTGAVHYALERGEPASGVIAPPALFAPGAPAELFDDLDEETGEPQDALSSEPAEETFERVGDGPEGESTGETDAEGRRKRRRRRRRGRGGDREGSGIAANAPQPPDDALDALTQWSGLEAPSPAEADIEPQAAASDAPAEAVVVDPVEAIVAVEEAEAPAEEASPRRRSRRGGRSAKETAPASAEAAPELNLALETTIEAAASGEGAGTAEAPAEAAPAAAPKARRAPRPRAPRRAAASEPAEASAPPGEAVGVPPEPSPTLAETAEEAAPLNPGGDDGAAAQPAPAADLAKPSQDEPARPKRSGWWQRAKASLKG